MSIDVSNVKETLRQFIVKTYLPGESIENLEDDTPLRTSGVLDSMATLGLVSFVEKEFGIELEAHETGIETFDTVGGIADLVLQKRGGR
jgi:acyl carrier protein